ncbi:MAG: hypothetical protein AAFQ13_10200 [Pseudomonadota bacterium]
MKNSDIAKGAAVAIFGIIVPIAILFQAYLGLSELRSDVSKHLTEQTTSEEYKQVRPLLQGANDYAFYNLLYSEKTNLAVVTNKQVMKVTVIQIGFAAISLGLMFVMLGVNDGGAEGAVEGSGIKVDFKTSSTGAVVFVVGALMATAGGVLKNEYVTVPIPGYIDRGDGVNQQAHIQALEIYEDCRSQPKIKYECFYKHFASEFALETE